MSDLEHIVEVLRRGGCWYSLKAVWYGLLARFVDRSLREVWACLRELEAKGVLVRRDGIAGGYWRMKIAG